MNVSTIIAAVLINREQNKDLMHTCFYIKEALKTLKRIIKILDLSQDYFSSAALFI